MFYIRRTFIIKRVLFFFLLIIENEGKDIILDITSIKLEGNTVFEDFQIETIL